jgi:hypothetical protein
LVVAVYNEPQVCDRAVGKRYMVTEEQRFADAGFRLIQLWKSEVDANPAVFDKMLLSAAGLDQAESIGARQCELDLNVEWNTTKAFYNANHPQGTTASLHQTVGLRYQGELVAAMSFSMSADRRGAASKSFEGASLTRYATSRRVAGGGGKLLNAWRKVNPGQAIMSYSDQRMFTGAMYKTLGFTAVKTGAPDYLVYNPVAHELRHKSAFQRKRLEHWRKALGRDDVAPYDHTTDPRTEFQMEDVLGLYRVYHTGLIRWELAA